MRSIDCWIRQCAGEVDRDRFRESAAGVCRVYAIKEAGVCDRFEV